MFTIATHAAAGRPNEDAVVVTPDLAVVVDGAGVPAGGCIHGVAWYARQLAARTITELVVDLARPLCDGLAAGIAAVAALHADTCDLTSPSTPCAAVGILRIGTDTVETLALSDASIAVQTLDGVHVTVDLAIEDLAGTEPQTLAGLAIGSPPHRAALQELVQRQTRTRNREGGWWVAAADPTAAGHAAHDSYPLLAVRRAVAFTDGATRPADQMGLYDWPGYLALLDDLGPAGLIEHVRDIERRDPEGRQYPRTKVHDDATIAAAHLAVMSDTPALPVITAAQV